MSGDASRGYFSLFGLEPRFALVMEKLDETYRALAMETHPDRFAHMDEAARRRSLQQTTRINEAYRTLKKPLLRARYLLDLRGAGTPEGAAPPPPEFLAEQMEWHEELGEARRAHDIGALRRLRSEVSDRSTTLHERLARQLDDEHDDLGAGATVDRLMFLERLMVEVADACAELED